MGKRNIESRRALRKAAEIAEKNHFNSALLRAFSAFSAI